MLVAFNLMALVWGGGYRLATWAVGLDFGPALTGPALGQFLRDYGLHMGLALAATLVAAGYAALAALLTRSVPGGLLAGLGLAIVETLSLMLLGVIAGVLDRPGVMNLYRFTPTYSLDNILSWVQHSRSYAPLYPAGFTAEPGPAFSVVVLLAWVAGLVGLTVWLFQRQDITS